MRFNTACLKRFEDVEYVELLFNSVEKCLAVRPCEKSNPNAIQWGTLKEGSKTILMDQTYGDKDDWKRHFEYLLPFFKDERYEKKDNKPLFMIFDSMFDEKEPMFKLWKGEVKDPSFAM